MASYFDWEKGLKKEKKQAGNALGINPKTFTDYMKHWRKANLNKEINPVSDYQECSYCTAKGTDKCPALYRKTENCPFYKEIQK